MPLHKQPRVLAIIPARGGSKGVPRKNIRPLSGKPLIAYTIEAAAGAQLLDRTVLSTEDTKIAAIAKKHGAEVPFMRPPELAKDESFAEPVMEHALGWLEEHEGYVPDYLLLLQPTSPLRTSQDIDNCINLALEKDAVGVVSICPVKHHPYLIKRLDEEGHIESFSPLDQMWRRRQDFPPAYGLTGAIYLVRREILLEQHALFHERTYAYIMPPERSLDIDTLWDFTLAELILKANGNQDGV